MVFMKLLTVALQRLVLHDLNTKCLKSEWFIKKMASRKETRLQAIRKPTRYYTVLVSMMFCDRDIKRILNKHEHPATRKDKILSPKERVTKSSIPPSHPPIAYGGCGVA